MARYIKVKIKGVDKEAWFGVGLMDLVNKNEEPKDGNIMNVSAIRLLYHSLAYGDEREGKEPEFSLIDLYDWADDRPKDYQKVADRFKIHLLKSFKKYTEDKDTLKTIDAAVEALTPEQAKKKD